VAGWLAVLTMGTIGAASLSGCESGGEHFMPGELIGTWKTAAPAYAGRTLRLSQTTVAFATGEDSGAAHPIRTVRRVSGPEGLLYTVVYTDSIEQELSFYYDSAKGGGIILKNQKQIRWKREG